MSSLATVDLKIDCPKGWHIDVLGSFGAFRSGNGFPLKYQGGQSGSIPFYKVSDMNGKGNSKRMVSANHWLEESGRKAIGAHLIPPDSIIFAKIGAAIFLERRRSLTMHSCIDNNVMAFIPDRTQASPLFFYYLFQSIPFGPLVSSTALPSLSGKDIAALSFAFPPLDEQHKIATALGDLDDLIASLDALIVKKRDIKRAAMQQLLTGKARLAGFVGEWRSKTLGEMVEFCKGRGLPKSALHPSGRYPCIHYGELFTVYGAIIGDVISRTHLNEGSFHSRADDVLMPTSDVTPSGLAKASCVQSDGVIIGGDALVIRPSPLHLSGIFLAYRIRQAQVDILKLVRGSTVFHLYASDLSKLKFGVPSVKEQRAVGEVLQDMDTELAAFQSKRDKLIDLKQGMMQQLLTGRIRLV